MSILRFEFTINTRHRLHHVPIPKRMRREVKELWTTWDKNRGDVIMTLRMGMDNNKHRVLLRDVVSANGSVEMCFSDGWDTFVMSNSLEIGDRILLTVDDYVELIYRVRIWRNEIEITRSNEVPLCDVDEPFFKFQFLKSYWDKPTINVPLAFAKANFNGLPKNSTVALYMNTEKYEAKMHIWRDRNKQIRACSIKKGVQEFIRGEEVEVDERVIVELYGMDPYPVLILTFT